MHIEVKFGVAGMDVGTALLRQAWEQGAKDCGMVPSIAPGEWVRIYNHDQIPVVLWKPLRKPWRLTWMDTCGLATVAGPEAIKGKLLELNDG